MKKNLYNNQFYQNQKYISLQSASEILPVILNILPKIQSAVDFGCGHGAWLKVLKDLGVNEIIGYDGNWVNEKDLLIPIENFQKTDLKSLFCFDRRYDLAISIEVAEHLPENSAELFIQTLIKSSDIILFSAAIPGQGGTNHANEQWQSYWFKLFQKKGYTGLEIRHLFWSNIKINVYHRQNIFLYVKNDTLSKFEYLQKNIIDQSALLIDIVHPELHLKNIKKMKSSKYFLIQKFPFIAKIINKIRSS